jgi:hypothetical protein
VNKGVKDKGGGEKNAHQHTPLIPFLPRRLFPVLNLQSQKMPFSGEMPRALTFYVIPPAHYQWNRPNLSKDLNANRKSPIKK